MQIRVAEERDAAALAEIYSYYVEKTAITFEYETPSTEKFTERIHNIWRGFFQLEDRAEGRRGRRRWHH